MANHQAINEMISILAECLPDAVACSIFQAIAGNSRKSWFDRRYPTVFCASDFGVWDTHIVDHPSTPDWCSEVKETLLYEYPEAVQCIWAIAIYF